MKSARHILLFLLAIAMLFSVAACLTETTDDGLNPQPLPPGSTESPEDPRAPNGAKQSGDTNGGAGGSSGSDAPPPSAAPAADAGADSGKHVDTRWAVPRVPR